MTLTPREYDVLRLLASGYTYQQAAHALHVSRTTVNTYRSHIAAKGNGGGIFDVLREVGWLRVPDRRAA